MGLTLRDGNREYFYKKLDENFPGLKEIYKKEYGDRYQISSPYNDELMEFFIKKTNENNIMNNYSEIFEYLQSFPGKRSIQKKLF
jgi:hypothetical protein